ncbi:hypothetical protein [Larkinella terrae]|uniref:Uncharacterized protein n=1 Tax=Larkinella terrae TaxID=2025311 RepID=A0A7K0EJ39_9BACT|nr:hypothetical protein [Larkinella terrae]MRS61752.1 hypothetical protein [Larkinella terrae]
MTKRSQPALPAPLWSDERLEAASAYLQSQWRFTTWQSFLEALAAARTESDLRRILVEVNRDKLPDDVHPDRARCYVIDRAKELGIRLSKRGGFRWVDD